MSQEDRVARALVRQDYERDQVQAAGASGGAFDDAGPPHWNRDSWEGFKRMYGSYPFGPQAEGGIIYPPSMEGAPDWVYALIGVHRRPGS